MHSREVALTALEYSAKAHAADSWDQLRNGLDLSPEKLATRVFAAAIICALGGHWFEGVAMLLYPKDKTRRVFPVHEVCARLVWRVATGKEME